MIGRMVQWAAACLGLAVVAGWGLPLQAAQMALDGQWITDSVGRRIHVRQPYQRIISLYGAHSENLFHMGAQSQVVGVTAGEERPPEANDLPVYSYHDGLEKFIAGRPDLVLIRPMIDRGYRQLIHRLEVLGVTVVSLQPSTTEEMYLYWSILGKLSGRTRQAHQMIDRFRQTSRRIRRRTSSCHPKKRVYFEAIHDRMRTFTPTAMAIFVLETAGGINVAGDAVSRRGTNIADYGLERLLSQADSIDVYLAQTGPMNRPTLEMIKTTPGYGLIRAVQQDQIHFIDEKLVSRPTMRLLDGICRIGGILYPQLFPVETRAMQCAGPTSEKDTQP